MGWFSGKEKKIKADPLAGQINQMGKSGLDTMSSGASKLTDLYNQDSGQFVQNQISRENRLLRDTANDATQRTRQLITQRGMGNSSIGLGQEVNQRQNLDEKINMNTATGAGRVREMNLQNGQGLMNVGNSLFDVKRNPGQIQMTDISLGRQGGFGKLAGALVGGAIGAYAGGPQGASTGAQMGSSLAGAFQKQ